MIKQSKKELYRDNLKLIEENRMLIAACMEKELIIEQQHKDIDKANELIMEAIGGLNGSTNCVHNTKP